MKRKGADGALWADAVEYDEENRRRTNFVVHSIRHTFLTRMGLTGVDIFTLMRIAGHSSVTVTQKYMHPSDENMERAFERWTEEQGTLTSTPVIHGPKASTAKKSGKARK
jgi:site-specific recombinase XerD